MDARPEAHVGMEDNSLMHQPRSESQKKKQKNKEIREKEPRTKKKKKKVHVKLIALRIDLQFFLLSQHHSINVVHQTSGQVN